MKTRSRYLASRQRLALKLGWLVPAALGAALAWPWWITLALLLPALAWYIETEGRSYYTESRITNATAPAAYHLPLIRAVPAIVPLCLLQGRFAGIVGAVVLVLVDQWPMGRLHVSNY